MNVSAARLMFHLYRGKTDCSEAIGHHRLCRPLFEHCFAQVSAIRDHGTFSQQKKRPVIRGTPKLPGRVLSLRSNRLSLCMKATALERTGERRTRKPQHLPPGSRGFLVGKATRGRNKTLFSFLFLQNREINPGRVYIFTVRC